MENHDFYILGSSNEEKWTRTVPKQKDFEN